MQYLEPEITELTINVWDTVFALTLSRSMDSPAWEDSSDLVHAHVDISGGWNGRVIVSFPARLLGKIAGGMFEMAPEELDDELRDDAMGEVANMVGGNVKGLLNGPSQLSLPQVRHGEDFASSGREEISRVLFDCEGDPVAVRVLKVEAGATENPDVGDPQDAASDPAMAR